MTDATTPTRLGNHQPQDCYADEYAKWRKAVEDIRLSHKGAVRFLRSGNTAGVRRMGKEQRRAIGRLGRALSNVADCGLSEPAVADAAPADNPFVGEWVQRLAGVGWENGPWVRDRVTMSISDDGRFLQRDRRNVFCGELGHGVVPLTIQGSGGFDLGASPRFDGSGEMHCYPRSRGRQMVGHPPMVFGYDRDADVLTIEAGGQCYWRQRTGSLSDCKAFWRGTPAPANDATDPVGESVSDLPAPLPADQ